MHLPGSDNTQSFQPFIEAFKKKLFSVFHERDHIEQFVQRRGFPALVLREIMAVNPLSVAIPARYGGRGAIVKESLGLLEAASYESLPLSLTFGINIALFLEPVVKYAREEVKQGIFDRFLNRQHMGGLMITEPDFGSDALNMQTVSEKVGNSYHISGVKHWQGLTGLADYWLITARNKVDKECLGRDLCFFICDVTQPGQAVHVEEYFNNLGLYPIPYGRNRIDVTIPEQFRLVPESTGLKLMMDLLHRSRYQFPGMGVGFIRRMLDEATDHCRSRVIGGKMLWSLDQVQFSISRIQSAFTISSAMCLRSAEVSGIEHNLAGAAIEANSFKAYITDLMQEAAQIVTQLSGANGYKAESVASRGIIDSRPFQIFEGSNEMLYTQISDLILKKMVKRKTDNLMEFFKGYELTRLVADRFKSLLNFSPGMGLSQRRLVDLGKIISRVISANLVAELGHRGYRGDLISSCLETIRHEVSALAGSYQSHSAVAPADNYNESSDWMAFC